MNTSLFFFFTAVFTLSRWHCVICRGINGCVQLSGVKQVVKGSYMILFQQGLNLWGCSPGCRLPACLLSNGTNYTATWVKQGNIHFRETVKSREKDARKQGSTECCLPSVEAIRTKSVSGGFKWSFLTFHSGWSLHIFSPPVSALVPALVVRYYGEEKGKDTKTRVFSELKENKYSPKLQRWPQLFRLQV